ncbi:MAG TPA: O-antigen ligase family protein [Terriglobales bacterium]
MRARAATLGFNTTEILVRGAEIFLRPLQATLAYPDLVFLATLALMLFHSPDFSFYSIDRFAFAGLIFVLFLRVCVLRLPFPFESRVTWPMLALVLLAFAGALTQPNEAETWSLFAAKWFVPFVLYELAILVFTDDESVHRFELLALAVFGYLSFISICFMLGFKELVFPRFILDECLGIHADRARGPFLQAVANGVALNLLGLIALDSFRRKRLRGVTAAAAVIALPLAIVATKTRAVWLSFAGTIVLLMISSPSRRVRRTCLTMCVAGAAVLIATTVFSSNRSDSLSDRLEERSPVDFRMAVYGAGRDMFLEKPLLGWDTQGMQSELSRRISEFHQREFYFHNTYLEILVRYGLLGLGLYIWLIFDLFRLGRKPPGAQFPEAPTFLDEQFRTVWPIFLGVYLVNGALVVMNYQFVNGLLFTVAGMLTAQNRRLAANPIPTSN